MKSSTPFPIHPQQLHPGSTALQGCCSVQNSLFTFLGALVGTKWAKIGFTLDHPVLIRPSRHSRCGLPPQGQWAVSWERSSGVWNHLEWWNNFFVHWGVTKLSHRWLLQVSRRVETWTFLTSQRNSPPCLLFVHKFLFVCFTKFQVKKFFSLLQFFRKILFFTSCLLCI